MAKKVAILTPGSTPAVVNLIVHDDIPEGLTQEQADARFYELDAICTAIREKEGTEGEAYAMAWYEVHHHVKAYGTPEDYVCPDPEPTTCQWEGCTTEAWSYCEAHWPTCIVKGCTSRASDGNMIWCEQHLARPYGSDLDWSDPTAARKAMRKLERRTAREVRLAQREGRLHPAQDWLPYYVKD